MVTRKSANMAKKPTAWQMAAAQQQDDLQLSLDLGDFESEDDSENMDHCSFSSGEANYDTDVDVSLDMFPDEGVDNSKIQTSVANVAAFGNCGGDNGQNLHLMALVPVDTAAPDPYDVDSEEEKDLLKDIKDEIKDMVRGEMHSELALYENKIKAIEAGCLPSVCGEGAEATGDKYPDLANMEPELRAAYIKMRKLDRILEKKEKREKQVKRERILMERRIREEISLLTKNGRFQRDIQTNTEKYLSLTLPPSHNQGVIVEEPPPVTPVFQTQVNEEDLDRGAHKSTSVDDDSSNTTESGRKSSSESVYSAATASTLLEDKNTPRQGHKKKKKKDFIKRNKELAANANDTIAMTDDEKKRLQDLLTDIDTLPEIPEEGMDITAEENPYQVAIPHGEGFCPSETELRSLTAIDQRLQSLMPEEEFRSIASSVLSRTPQQRLFTRVGARAEVDFEAYGEKALMEAKDEREFQAKMKEIEERLAAFHDLDTSQTEVPKLTQAQLGDLLDDCVRCMSCMSASLDTLRSSDISSSCDLPRFESARAQLMQNPPQLSAEVLEKLLSEAHFPLSSRLLALQDDDSKSGQGSAVGRGILAETWKAIAEQNLSEYDDDDDDDDSTAGSSRRGHSQSRNRNWPGTTTAVYPAPVTWSGRTPQPNLFDHQPQAQARRSATYQPYSSLDAEDGRLSLPDICASPLINTPQGGPAAGGANNVLQYPSSGRNSARGSRAQNSGYPENMIRNDLSWDSGTPFSSRGPRAEGTPLLVEDIREQSMPTTPHPPSVSGRRSGERLGKSRMNTPDLST